MTRKSYKNRKSRNGRRAKIKSTVKREKKLLNNTGRVKEKVPYCKFDKRRCTVIFDLDETLIDARSVKNTTTDMTRATFPSHGEFFIMKLNLNKDYMVFIRPYTIELLIHCFHYFNVAFWSSGEHSYVKTVVEHLMGFCKRDISDLCFAWGRSDTGTTFTDAFTSKTIPDALKMGNNNYHKNLQTVFKLFPTCNPSSTFLFDNLPTHSLFNSPNNIVYVPPYAFQNHNDTILRNLLEIIRGKQYKEWKIPNKLEIPFRSLLIEELVAHKGKCIHISKEDFKIFERRSPTNDNTYYSSGYISSNIMGRTIDTSFLTKGRRVIIVDSEYPFARLPGHVLQTKCNKTKVSVRTIDSDHTFTSLYHLSKDMTDITCKDVKNALKFMTKTVPVSNVVGLYEYWGDTLNFNVPSKIIEAYI